MQNSTSCDSIMNYDSYFRAEICVKCGRIERKNTVEIQRNIDNQSQSFSITKRIVDVMMVHS